MFAPRNILLDHENRSDPVELGTTDHSYLSPMPMVLLRCIPIALPILFGLAHIISLVSMPVPDKAIPDSAEKKRIIQNVFDDLLEAIGGGERPTLEFSDQGSLAEYNKRSGRICVNVELLDLCGEYLGDDSLNALAWVLGHEIAHYYSSRRTTEAILDAAWRGALGKITRDTNAVREAKADYFSGFYGSLAGYDVLKRTPEVLEMLYHRDSLPYRMRGYPALGVRKMIAMNVRDSLNRLIPTFDIGNYLALVRQYPEAQRCYEHVIATFPSRELINNTGVVYALQALDLMGDGVEYVYPLELDADTRLGGTTVIDGSLDRATRSPNPGDERTIRRLLDNAEQRFAEAGEKDKRYASALINLATIYILKQKYSEALRTATQAMELDMSPSARARTSIVLSIAHMLNGNSEKASQIMDTARKYARGTDADSLVEVNAAIMERRTFSITTSLGSREAEKISGIGADDTSTLWQPFFEYPIDGKYTMSFLYRSFNACDLFRARKDDSWAQFVSTRSSYNEKTSKKIALGDPVDSVKKLYGQTPRIVNARQGSYYVYEFSKIIFLIDENGRVRKWIVYTIA